MKEELKSAHEEVLSANEEFQSTNEELETAKEELQSANEELTTTNDELGSRNRELSVLNIELQKARQISDHARDYAELIVETVREPLLVLDGELRVRRANHAFYTDFKTSREDVEGHIIYDLGDGQWNNPLLRERLLAVLARNEPMDAHEMSRSVATIGERILSLNARKIPGDGERAESILLAVEDVTAQHAATDILRNDGRRKDEFLAMLAHELRTPLAPIAHAIHLLRRAKGTDGPSKTPFDDRAADPAAHSPGQRFAGHRADQPWPDRAEAEKSISVPSHSTRPTRPVPHRAEDRNWC